MREELGGELLRRVHEDCPAWPDGGKPRADARMTLLGRAQYLFDAVLENLAQMGAGACFFRHRLADVVRARGSRPRKLSARTGLRPAVGSERLQRLVRQYLL